LTNNDLMAPQSTTGEGDGKIAVCKIIIPGLLETYSIVVGIKDLTSPSLGRFFVSDTQNRLYRGYLAQNIELNISSSGRLDWNVSRCNLDHKCYSLTEVVSFNEALKNFQLSPHGEKLKRKLEEQGKIAIAYYKQGKYSLALPIFEVLSVYGFFTHSQIETKIIYYNLASTYYKLFKKR